MQDSKLDHKNLALNYECGKKLLCSLMVQQWILLNLGIFLMDLYRFTTPSQMPVSLYSTQLYFDLSLLVWEHCFPLPQPGSAVLHLTAHVSECQNLLGCISVSSDLHNDEMKIH